MIHWSDRNIIEQFSTGECSLQDDAPEFLEEADALLEKQTLEHLIGAVQGCYSPLAKKRPKVVDDEGL
jgi:hypothetical protein